MISRIVATCLQIIALTFILPVLGLILLSESFNRLWNWVGKHGAIK